MNISTLSLIISIAAFLLALSKWIYDFRRQFIESGYQGRRYGKTRGRVEFLSKQTNCFITRGSYLLFLVSFRIYNDSDQVPSLIQDCTLSARIGFKWYEMEPHEHPQAFYPSLLRNNLPLSLEALEKQDFYEVFQLDEVPSSTDVKVKLRCLEKNGASFEIRNELHHRTDERQIFDILFIVPSAEETPIKLG